MCDHRPGAHPTQKGKRLTDGAFASRLTAEYPPQLARVLAEFFQPFLTPQNRIVTISAWRARLPTKPAWQVSNVRVEDGGGLLSTADWLRPRSGDHLSSLRRAWSQRLLTDGLCNKIARHFSAAPEAPPLDDAELQPFLADLCHFFSVSDRESFLSISPGQPFRLGVFQRLLRCTQDPEECLCPMLAEGVRLGVGVPLAPSIHSTLHGSSAQVDLTICEGSWASATSHPTEVETLLAEELKAG